MLGQFWRTIKLYPQITNNQNHILLIDRGINDPEHPLTLEQLDVVKLDDVEVDDKNNLVNVIFTPTIPHCSMATLIGLSIRVKLLRSLPPRFKVQLLDIRFYDKLAKITSLILTC